MKPPTRVRFAGPGLLQFRPNDVADAEWREVGILDEVVLSLPAVVAADVVRRPRALPSVELEIGNVRADTMLALYRGAVGRRSGDADPLDPTGLVRLVERGVGRARPGNVAIRMTALTNDRGELVTIELAAWSPRAPRSRVDGAGRLVSVSIAGTAAAVSTHMDALLGASGRITAAVQLDWRRPPARPGQPHDGV